MERFKRLLLNPFLISAIVCLLIYPFLPDFFPKYEFTLNETIIQNEVLEYRHDIDHDSITELIRLGYNYKDTKELPYIILSDFDSVSHTSYTVNQHNFNSPWIEQPGMCFGNYDKNLTDEVYFFTHRGDSLFLTGNDPSDKEPLFLERFISKVTFTNGNPDFRIYFGGIHNINNDNYGDVVFSIWAWYSIVPRGIFIYDIKNDSLYKSNTQDVCFFNPPKVVHDKRLGPIILSDSYAPDNQKEGSKAVFADSVSWLMAFDSKLEPLFLPIPYGTFTSGVYLSPIASDSNINIYARLVQPDKHGESFLAKYDLSGKLISKRILKDLRESQIIVPDLTNTNLFLKTKKNIIRFDKNLETIHNELHKYPGVVLRVFDIDNDNNNEIINFNQQTKKLTVFEENFTQPVSLTLNDDISLSHFSKTTFYESDINLMIHYNNRTLLLTYKLNNLYYYQFLIYFIFYVIIVGFFYLLLLLQKNYLQSKYEQEMKVNELVLLTIKNQVEPHFIFNVINSISSMIYEEDRKKAYQFLIDFSNLIRTSLTNALKIEIKLADELEFVERYLDLERIRYKNSFDYEIEIAPDVDTYEAIPRMVIHTFAENAVKHGLAGKKENGQLFIKVTSD